jgi:hypothetical protein
MCSPARRAMRAFTPSRSGWSWLPGIATSGTPRSPTSSPTNHSHASSADSAGTGVSNTSPATTTTSGSSRSTIASRLASASRCCSASEKPLSRLPRCQSAVWMNLTIRASCRYLTGACVVGHRQAATTPSGAARGVMFLGAAGLFERLGSTPGAPLMTRPVIAKSFTDSLAKLSHDDTRLAKLALADLVIDASYPGLKQHPVQGRDPNMWSARVNDDIRIIMNKREAETIFCYVAHHDDAYAWAERRRFEVNEETGAAQIVVIDERVEEVVKHVTRIEDATATPPTRPFEHYDDEALMRYGVPRAWTAAIRAATLDEFFEIGDDLPDEAQEYLLALASGETPEVPAPTPDPFAHPDAKRRFAILGDDEALARALAAPWETWQLFLHPHQQVAVDRDHAGPARVTGGAGTGKTVVALHRAARLARSTNGRVLLTTFSRTLAARLRQQLDDLLRDEDAARARIDVENLHHLAMELWRGWTGSSLKVAAPRDVHKIVDEVLAEIGPARHSPQFLKGEWDMVIEPYGITTWPEYAAVERTARGGSLAVSGREEAWRVLSRVRELLAERGRTTWSSLCWAVIDRLDRDGAPPYEHVIADEVQDFGPAELRLLRALVTEGPNDVFLASDVNQRIYKPRAAFARAGIEVRGRTTVLTLNYRTTEQIRRVVDRIVAGAAPDPDDDAQHRPTSSLVTGPDPELRTLPTVNGEIDAVAAWLQNLVSNGYRPTEIAVLARTHQLVQDRVRAAVRRAGLTPQPLDDDEPPADKRVAIGTMHRGKGLQFRAVAVMAAEEGQVPLLGVLDRQPDEAARHAFLELERNLLYVACSRARERLLVTAVRRPSRYLPREGAA